ncbi:MAG: TfoX/Sxy family transcriptional regulator of competence genes [Planctomycetota bacterium]|jgi:TfoX/Sxy family transcriptional regulator of competence genes
MNRYYDSRVVYDEELADRVRISLREQSDITAKKMFGGMAFLLHGYMCCGIVDNTLTLRLGAEGVQAALERSHTRPVDFTGKVINTMVYVEPEGIRSDASLAQWVERGVDFASSLPRKAKKA